VLALGEQIEAGVNTHLYLTDHRSLSVARLVEITDEPVQESYPGEPGHMPDHYRDHEVAFWFRNWDLPRLAHRDTPAVVEELKMLRNLRYHDRPVSLYGGLVDLPLLDPADDVSHQSPGTLQHLVEHDGTVRNGPKQTLGNDAARVLNQLPYRMKPIREMRNPAAHEDTVTRRHVGHQRERIPGIGQEGLINRIVRRKGVP